MGTYMGKVQGLEGRERKLTRSGLGVGREWGGGRMVKDLRGREE